ncbi:GNAT family N-acetyltransferase [Maribacter thermophilus]|uniref:GNAT family N-acetyltransferase n=1 Tax=Maribacter thermophilus TaxID=1197874 RepID=UPI0006417879|nr:GNAT family N-acetyltransferase [Maribacter thermophilus]
MKENIIIREAQKTDLPVLLQCEQEVIAAERPYDPSIRNETVTYYNLLDLMKNSRAVVLVACDKDKIVATGYALEKPARHYLDHETYAYLGFMYTDPVYRGQGINGSIIDRLKTWALSKGLTELRLTVYNENEPAIKACEKVGFKRHIVEMRVRIGE